MSHHSSFLLEDIFSLFLIIGICRKNIQQSTKVNMGIQKAQKNGQLRSVSLADQCGKDNRLQLP